MKKGTPNLFKKIWPLTTVLQIHKWKKYCREAYTFFFIKNYQLA